MEHNVPKWVTGSFPNIVKVVNGEKFTDDKGFKITSLTSLGGVKFSGFAKLPNFGKDLYSDLVAQTLNTDLKVETWQNGGGNKMPSNCNSNHSVMNIGQINFDKSFTEPVVKFASVKGEKLPESFNLPFPYQ